MVRRRDLHRLDERVRGPSHRLAPANVFGPIQTQVVQRRLHTTTWRWVRQGHRHRRCTDRPGSRAIATGHHRQQPHQLRHASGQRHTSARMDQRPKRLRATASASDAESHASRDRLPLHPSPQGRRGVDLHMKQERRTEKKKLILPLPSFSCKIKQSVQLSYIVTYVYTSKPHFLMISINIRSMWKKTKIKTIPVDRAGTGVRRKRRSTFLFSVFVDHFFCFFFLFLWNSAAFREHPKTQTPRSPEYPEKVGPSRDLGASHVTAASRTALLLPIFLCALSFRVSFHTLAPGCFCSFCHLVIVR